MLAPGGPTVSQLLGNVKCSCLRAPSHYLLVGPEWWRSFAEPRGKLEYCYVTQKLLPVPTMEQLHIETL